MAGTWSSGGNLSTASQALAGCGTQTAGLSFGGTTGSVSNVTEEYNGSAWSSGGNLATARHSLGGAGTQSAALSFGGATPSVSNVTEEYNGSAWSSGGNLSTAKHALAGCGTQTAGLAFGGYQDLNVTEEYNGSTWSSGGNLATARSHLAGCGTQTAGLSFGGSVGVWVGTAQNVTEEYNGTAWSSGGNLSTAKRTLSGCGSQTVGLSFGGETGTANNTTEEYNGTSWSSGGNLATARYDLAGAGTQSAGLSFGGYTGSVSNVTEEYGAAGLISAFQDWELLYGDASTPREDWELLYGDASTPREDWELLYGDGWLANDWDIVYSFPIAQDIEEPYDIPIGEFPFNYVVEYYRNRAVPIREVVEWYQGSPLPYNAIVIHYENVPFAVSSFIEKYEGYIISSVSVDIPYVLLTQPIISVNEPYAICEVAVRNDKEEIYNLNLRDPASSETVEFYSLLSGTSEIQSFDISVMVDDTIIDPYSISINGNLQGYCLTLSMTVASMSEYQICSYGKIAIITVGTEVFKFFLEGKSRSREHGSSTYNITGTSLLCQLDRPKTDSLLKTWNTAITAKEVVEELAVDFIDDVTYPDWYEGVDWSLPANTLFANDESPIEVIRKLTRASGGVVQPYIDGSLRIRKRYPVAVPNWTTTSADFTLSDEADFFNSSESFEFKEGYNKVLVSNSDVSDSNRIRIDEVEVNSQTKKLRCFLTPFHENFTLHTSKDDAIIELMGIVEEVITETIEIVEGSGTVSKPIYSEDTSLREYIDTQLGAVTFSENGNLTTEISGQSLLKITYTTKYREYLVTGIGICDAQFWTEG